MVYGLWFAVLGLMLMVFIVCHFVLWLMVDGLGFVVYGLWFKVCGLLFVVYGFGFGVWVLG